MKQQALNIVVDTVKENLVNTIKSHIVFPKVHPKVGSIVHCSLYGVEHSGIYIGDNTIVQLEGNGKISAVSPKGFVSKTNAIAIYVACDSQNNVLHAEEIARRAVHQIGKKINYNLLINNCHKFTSGCILGDFNNINLMFSALEAVIKNYFFKQHLTSPLQVITEKLVNFSNRLNLSAKNQNLYSIENVKDTCSQENKIADNNQELCWRIWDNEITPKSEIKRIAKHIPATAKLVSKVSKNLKTTSELLLENTINKIKK